MKNLAMDLSNWRFGYKHKCFKNKLGEQCKPKTVFPGYSYQETK